MAHLQLLVAMVRSKFKYVNVIEAVNGHQVVELAKDHSPHLILMDIKMPVMDGIEAMKMLKSEQTTSGIPIVAVTGYSTGTNDENMKMFMDKGFDGYISKPFHVIKLFAEVQKHLSQKSSYAS